MQNWFKTTVSTSFYHFKEEILNDKYLSPIYIYQIDECKMIEIENKLKKYKDE